MPKPWTCLRRRPWAVDFSLAIARLSTPQPKTPPHPPKKSAKRSVATQGKVVPINSARRSQGGLTHNVIPRVPIRSDPADPELQFQPGRPRMVRNCDVCAAQGVFGSPRREGQCKALGSYARPASPDLAAVCLVPLPEGPPSRLLLAERHQDVRCEKEEAGIAQKRRRF